MLAWLSSIGQAFGAILNFFTSTITGIIQLFALIPQAMLFLTAIWAYIPPVLLAFALAGIGIVVFFQLIGR